MKPEQFGNQFEENDKDKAYSERHWNSLVARGKKPELIEGLKQAMRDSIISNATSNEKIVGLFVNKDGLTEEDKAKISAIRILAKELGYEIGQFKLNKTAGTATADIRKIE